MRFRRTAVVFLVLVFFGVRPAGVAAESPGENPAPKTPTSSASAADPEAESTPPVPVGGEGRGARKKSVDRPFRPSIDVPAGDAVSFPVDI